MWWFKKRDPRSKYSKLAHAIVKLAERYQDHLEPNAVEDIEIDCMHGEEAYAFEILTTLLYEANCKPRADDFNKLRSLAKEMRFTENQWNFWDTLPQENINTHEQETRHLLHTKLSQLLHNLLHHRQHHP